MCNDRNVAQYSIYSFEIEDFDKMKDWSASARDLTSVGCFVVRYINKGRVL